MPLFLSGLGMSSYFLALCYFLASFLTWTRFRQLNAFLASHGVKWSIVQLLILSIALGCTFRCMSFSTLCILDLQQASSRISPPALTSPLEPNFHSNLSFYNKIVAVLYNLPDYLFVSSYLLVVLAWAEAFQSSRMHWFSPEQFRRRWIIFYLVFNAALYLTQIILYALLFLSPDKDIFVDSSAHELTLIPSLIFYVLAAADLFLPLIILCTWIYLTLTLSGFPYRSMAAKIRLGRVGRVMMTWSSGRILYSILILLTFSKGWFSVDVHNATTQSMILVAVFLGSELAPVYLALDSELLAMLSDDNYEPLVSRHERLSFSA